MPGMQFEYDEKGGTFYYFVLSFYALVLIPVTYYLWPSWESKDSGKLRRLCHCEACQAKRQRLHSKRPWTTFKRKGVTIGLGIAWVIFMILIYKVSQLELDHVEYDPFIELGIDRDASTIEIKKAYRKLSLKYHPDGKTGDSKKFMRIAKAHEALTNEESRKNWQEYGSPDGPGATHFGIALPKWIVEKQNSIWVLAMYGLVFMVVLPVAVGTWWYRSIKFSGDQVLLDTTQLYYYFFHKTPNMIMKRVIMILAGSMEFEKGHNPEICERPSDNEEIPAVMRELQNLEEKKRERPLFYPYSIKARALIHSHLSRLELPPKSLELDKQLILKKCPYLINEMVTIVAQLVALAHAGRASHVPRIETIENTMKLSQMIIQALWDKKSALLQLPHIREDMLRHFQNKRRHIRSIEEFVKMTEEDRRIMLRSMSDDDYRDVMIVCASMPYIQMNVTSGVLDDDDSTVTAGSIVTVTVELVRQNMEVLFDKDLNLNELEEISLEENEDEGALEEKGDGMDEDEEDDDNENEKENKNKAATDSTAPKPKVWEKQQKKKKGGASKKKKKPVKQPYVRNAVKKEEENKENAVALANKEKKDAKRERVEDNDEESGSNMSESEGGEESTPTTRRKNRKPEDDEEDWMKFQEEAKKENALETKSKESHVVHCPYFPIEKHEWWWVYVTDRKNHSLITAPVQICGLKEREEVQLKFSAPPKPGLYHYQVCLKSDSYLDFDRSHTVKLDVKEARKVENHPQWDISDEDEDHDEEDVSDSEGTTDYEDSD
ncbi:translocation protein SEC63 homolog [Lineus longissimus]|uniref:translocation protein SEC63 homolog n=1 Tax=Lineus longissimus TaxID=88925 RepID=UPI002B4D09C8